MTSDLKRCDLVLFTRQISRDILYNSNKDIRCTKYFYQINRCMVFHYLYLGNDNFKDFIKKNKDLIYHEDFLKYRFLHELSP